MLAFRLGIVFVFALITNLGLGHSEELPDQRPFLRIETGMHVTRIGGVSVSADGRFMATGSDDKTVRLWSVVDQKLLRTFRVPIGEGAGGDIHDIALSPDGKLLAAGGWDAYGDKNQAGYIYLFDTGSGSLLRRLGPTTATFASLKFSPDGRYFATGMGASGGVQLWIFPFEGKGIAAEGRVRGSIYGIDFDKDGRLAATSFDGYLRLYQISEGQRTRVKLIKRRKAPDGKQPYDIAFSPDATRLVVGYGDNTTVSVVNADDLRPIKDLASSENLEKNGNLAVVAWSRDDVIYAGGQYDEGGTNPLVAWSNGGRDNPRRVPVANGTIMDLASLQNGSIAFGSADPSIGIVTADGKQTFHRGPVTAVMWGKIANHFLVARDGSAVWFGLKEDSGDPWLFDAKKLTFTSAPDRPADFLQPNTTLLKVTDWKDNEVPKLDGRQLKLYSEDTSRSLAIGPDGGSFVLGTDFELHRFDSRGRELSSWPGQIPASAWGVNLSASGSIVVSALGDGTIRWYRAADGKELMAFFVHVPDKRWIAWTPSGYYAASPGGEDLFGWHVNGRSWDDTPQFYPASRFRDQYYRPDVVQLVLDTLDEDAALAAANAAAGRDENAKTIEELLPASVELLADAPEIQTGEKEIAVKYRLSSPTGRSVTRVEARIDGRPVITRGMEVITEDFPLGETLEAHITIPARDSELSLIAYIGDQPSVAATIPIKWTRPTVENHNSKLFALLVGVSDYANPNLRLSYAAKDADDLAKALEVQRGRLYKDVEIVELLDGKASKSAVETALAELKKEVGSDDTVVVFLAGHGMTDKRYDFYYLTADADLDPDMLSATAVDGALIRKSLSQVPGRVVLFMDACRSGAAVAGKVDMNRLSNDFAQDTSGLVMFASSQGREDSLESSAWQNGAFTEAMLSILADSSVYGADKQLSVPELEEALTVRVRELTEDRQSPVMTKYGDVPRFFIAATQ
ncbi:MAG: caspase family protein [Parvibaculaceae bacterium]